MAALEDETYRVLASAVDAMATRLGLPISMPNVPFAPPEGPKGARLPYLELSYQPAGAQLDSLGFDPDDASMQGLVQVSVYYPAGSGLVKPHVMAASVAASFPAGARLDGNGFTVYVDRRPDVGPSIQDSDLVHVPVTVRWRSSKTLT